jgi:ribosomal protein S18 acetylase RimI-like enzyme
VNPKNQNQGIARKLMDFAEQRAMANGFAAIRLDCYSTNEKAVRFYENLDYLKRGEIFFPGRHHPFFCYEKLLNVV